MKNFTKFTNLSKVVQKYQMVKIYDVVRLILLCPNFLKCRFIILFIPFFKKMFYFISLTAILCPWKFVKPSLKTF